MHFLFLLVICVYIADGATYSERITRDADDECRPQHPPPGPPPECCKVPDMSKKYPELLEACKHLKPAPPPNGHPPSGPSHMGPPDDIGCFFECMYNASGLLGKDNKIDKEEFIKHVNKTVPTIDEFKNHFIHLMVGMEKCFHKDVYADVDKHKCKSGAIELHMCLERDIFLVSIYFKYLKII
uniref:Uncharacterized protein n=1 Tax=Clastoptera arizonana TaxID=38151 RepID=A0A1B6C2F0_9HEMI